MVRVPSFPIYAFNNELSKNFNSCISVSTGLICSIKASSKMFLKILRVSNQKFILLRQILNSPKTNKNFNFDLPRVSISFFSVTTIGSFQSFVKSLFDNFLVIEKFWNQKVVDFLLSFWFLTARKSNRVAMSFGIIPLFHLTSNCKCWLDFLLSKFFCSRGSNKFSKKKKFCSLCQTPDGPRMPDCF